MAVLPDLRKYLILVWTHRQELAQSQKDEFDTLTTKANSDICLLCEKERETIDYFFVHSGFTYSLWCRFIGHSGVGWCFPNSLAGLFQAWRSSPFFLGNGAACWRLIPYAISWSIWGERYNSVFTGSSKPKEDVMLSVLRKIAKWASGRKGFGFLRVDGILHIWEASLFDGSHKESILAVRASPSVEELNGAS